jgi:hypothetical protein
MVRRLFVGLIVGLFVGCAVAAGLVAGLRVHEFGDLGAGGVLLAYLSAALTGLLTGLVAGKPIWASNAKIEGGLKAAFGALLGAGLLLALRQWGGGFQPDLGFIGAGHGSVGELPAASLPLLAALLGAFFELDNTGDGEQGAEKGPGRVEERKRVSATNGSSRARVMDASDAADGDEAEGASGRAKR